MSRADWLAEAAASGRADARAGRPISTAYVDDPDDCSAEANAYRCAYDAQRRAMRAAPSAAAAAE